MSRSSKKGPFVDPKLLKKISLTKPEGSKVIKTWSRASEISPEMVGYTGHRLGEFSLTRKFTRHGGKMQRDLEQKTKDVGTAAAKDAKAKK